MDKHKAQLNWYYQQEKKRKEAREKNDTTLINQRMQELLGNAWHKLSDEEKEDFKPVVKCIERKLVQSPLFGMRYRDNFENLDVAILQVILLSMIAPNRKQEIARWKGEISRVDFHSNVRFVQLERELSRI
ncbi:MULTISPECIES: hypothetical protein [unclassified Psychrobacillus]|uniref:hypothetical protein n=1 Tax=unclassified Psychrobacillus TaxID=2636677 RepID=UPI0030FA912F